MLGRQKKKTAKKLFECLNIVDLGGTYVIRFVPARC